MKKKWKRILAAFLAASMIFGNAVPAYATESEPVIEVVEAETEEETTEDVMTEVVVETETEETTEDSVTETVEEGSTEEIWVQETVAEVSKVNEYNSDGTLYRVNSEMFKLYNYSDDGSHYLIIELNEVAESVVSFLASEIGKAKSEMSKEIEATGAGYDYVRIEVQYNDPTDQIIPAELWNALVDYQNAGAAEETDTWFFFFNSYDIMYKYVFENIQEITDTSSVIDMSMSANVTGDSATVTFSNTTFAASDERVFFEITSLRDKDIVDDFTSYFGTEDAELQLWDTTSSTVRDNRTRYFVGDAV